MASRRRPYFKPQWEIEKEKNDRLAEEKRKEAERGLENTETNFPVLCAAAPKNTSWVGRKTFSQLATEWKETEDEKKRREDMEKATGIDADTPFILPTFQNVHRFVEPEEEQPVEEPKKEPSPEDLEEIGWTIVQNRKPRVKKEIEFKEEDAESSEGSQDDTVWNTREEHETCWDDRRNY